MILTFMQVVLKMGSPEACNDISLDLEMQYFRLHRRYTELESLGWGPAICVQHIVQVILVQAEV